MVPNVTFVTAVAPYHNDLLPAAVQSVKAQTIPCEHVIIYDTEQKGAGWARNQGLAQVKTDFVVFLDADDTVSPNFAAHTLAAFDGYHYIYTDFNYNGEVVRTPDTKHFIEGNDQVITCLIPTIWVKAIGGFDESLLGAEDTKLYLSLQASRRCGKRLAEPLFNYGRAGRRANEFVHGPHFDATMHGMSQLRGEAMACCGENIDIPQLSEPQPGDVLARALWGGNRTVNGRVTGRQYPRTGNGKVESVHPDDVAAAPHMWQQVQSAPQPEKFVPREPTFKVGEMITTIDEAAMAFFGTSPNTRVQTADELRAMQPAQVVPDVAKVQAIIGKARDKAKAGKK